MKNTLKMLVVTFLLCIMTFAVSAQQNTVTVKIDGVPLDCASYGQEATIVDGRTLVPLRSIFEKLGATVEWDHDTRTVTSTLDDVTIKLTIGKKFLYRNGKKITLDVPAGLMNNRTMVPVRAISESFGVDVEWNAETRQVLLLTGGYMRGTISDDTYRSEWIGIEFNLPENYTFSDEAYLRELMGLVADAKLSEIDIDKEILIYEFHVANGGSNASFFVEKKQSGETLEQYIRRASADGFETMAVSYEAGEFHTETIGGFVFKSLDLSVDLYGTKLYLTVSAFEKDEYIVGILSCYYDTATHVEMLESFKEIDDTNDSENTQEDLTENQNEITQTEE